MEPFWISHLSKMGDPSCDMIRKTFQTFLMVVSIRTSRFPLFPYVRVVLWRVTNRANQASGHANCTLEFISIQISTLMRRFSVVVDKTFNIKPDTLLLTTSITRNVQQVTREKVWKRFLSLGLTDPYKTVYPKTSVYSKFQLAGNTFTQILQTGF